MGLQMLRDTNLQSCYQGPLHCIFLTSRLHTSKTTRLRPYGTGCCSGHGNSITPLVRGPVVRSSLEAWGGAGTRKHHPAPA